MVSFIGRATELNQIEAILVEPECQLLTLIGPGGVGKTRLAYQIAERCQASFPDGIHIIELANLESASYFLATLAEHLGIGGTEDPLSRIIAVLTDRRILLVLDNFDDILPGANVLAQLLAALPNLTCLVTSQVVLQLSSERLYPVSGLAIPPRTSDGITGYDAVTLFLARARQVKPDFSADGQESHLIDLCHLVDGVPLALELAAAWTRLLTLQEIISEIENCMDFLANETRDAPSRQQSLRAVFQSAWNRLSERGQLILQRLSVFRGTFDRIAAAEIAQASLTDLASLADQSLLRIPEAGQFDLHSVIRTYAAERLAASDEYDSTHQQHSAYYLNLARDLTPRLKGSEQQTALQAWDFCIDNLRNAWSWAANNGHVDWVGDALQGVVLYHQVRCYNLQAIDLMECASEQVPPDSHLFQALTLYHGWFLIEEGRPYDGLALMRPIIRSVDASEGLLGLSFPLGAMTWHRETLGEVYALLQAILENNRHFAEITGDHWEAAFANYALGAAALMENRLGTARAYLSQGLEHANRLEDRWGSTWMLGTLGRVALAEQAYDEALQYFEMTYNICEALGDTTGCEFTVREMASVAAALGDDGSVIAHLTHSIKLALSRTPEYSILTYPLQQTSSYLASRARDAEALEIAATLIDHPQVLNAWWPSEVVELKQLYEQLEQTLPSGVFNAARIRGQERTLMETAHFALDVLNGSSREPTPTVNTGLPDPLTEREMDVLQLLAAGHSNRQIADRLTISLSTAKTHVHNIGSKLDTNNRTETVARARTLDLI